MSPLFLFVIEITLCLSISFALIYLLRPVLRQMLVETCGTQVRADFWLMFTQLMLVISPLLLVIFFAPTDPQHTVNSVKIIQDTLFRSLLGDFIALSTIGQVIWKSIDFDANNTAQHEG